MRCERVNFISPNVINLSTRILSKAEISLLSKDSKFIPTPTSVNKALIKEELERFGKLHLGYLEDKVLNSLVEKTPSCWLYTDDVFIIWQHGEGKLKAFLKIFNNCDPRIIFTAE